MTLFVIDALGERTFEGFTDGTQWNGWVVPFFSFAQAQKIVNAWHDCGWDAHYDESKDSFVFSVSHDLSSGKPDTFEEFASIEREGIKYYGIGAFSWIWEIAEFPLK